MSNTRQQYRVTNYFRLEYMNVYRLNWPRDSILYIINTKTNINTFNVM